jgi:hypothetical protein
MSDHSIVLVPEESEFVPSAEAQEKAVALMRSLVRPVVRWSDVKAQVTTDIRFIDCGENFERVVCPICSAELDMRWWAARLDHEFAHKFPLPEIELPCCGAMKRLNQLIYEFPQAFGRFSLEAMNPNIGELSEEALDEFEAVLGCRLSVVYRHV